MEKPKTIKQLLREHLKEREEIWGRLIIRLGWLKHLAEREKNSFLLHFLEDIEAHRSLELLYKSLIWKRSDNQEDKTSEIEQQYTPYERTSTDIQERLKSGLAQRLFQSN